VIGRSSLFCCRQHGDRCGPTDRDVQMKCRAGDIAIGAAGDRPRRWRARPGLCPGGRVGSA
jgi:hypothetical protein